MTRSSSARGPSQISAESVARRVRVLAAIAAPGRRRDNHLPDAAAPPQVHVPLPDLSRFDQLLGDHESTETLIL